MSLRVKIPLLIGLVVLASCAGIVITVETIVSESMAEDIRNELAGEISVQGKLIQATIDTSLVQLWEIANRARTRNMDWEGSTMDSLAPDVKRIDSLDIGLVLPDGTTHYALDRKTVAKLGDRNYVKKAFSGEKAADVVLSRTTGDLVAMLASPILKNDEPGAPVIGVLVARKRAKFLSDLVASIKLNRDSSYTVLVNKEGTYIAHPDSSLVEKEYNPIKEAQNDPSLKSLGAMVAKAIKDGSGHTEYVLNGKKKFCAFSEVHGYPWTLIFTVEKDDALKNAAKIRSTLFLIGAICTIVGIGIAIIIGGSISRPVVRVAAALKNISEGDLTTRVSDGRDRRDELGSLVGAVDKLASNLQTIMKNMRENSDTLAGAGEELSAVSRQLASGAEETVSQSSTVASTTEKMAANINAMANGAEAASVNATEVAGAAEEMSVNIGTIAGSISEMNASIARISENTVGVRKVALEATNKAADATDVMNKLGAAAKEIGQVTDVIKKIADKTNLLALNATIEAASAGEAGKGFAVVAGEIKELANQSAQSADDIARRIEGIQSGTNSAVEVINNVSDIIMKINQSVAAISDNVEQQTRSSHEITNNVEQSNTGAKRVASAIAEVAQGSGDVSRNAGEAAKGAARVSDNIAAMSQVASDSAQGASQVNQSAGDLARIAEELRRAVAQFKV